MDLWKPAESNFKAGKLTIGQVTKDTIAASARLYHDGPAADPLVMPIYHSSTYRLVNCDQFSDAISNGYVYKRLASPTTEAVEAVINELEDGAGCVAFCSGMAAICTTMLAFLRPGDHVVSCNPVYSGTHKFFTSYLPRYNIEVTLVPEECPVEEYTKYVRANTRMLYGETPCNPKMSILDLDAFGKLGQSLNNVITVVDSTFGSCYLQQPIKHGVDICIHSCTKYIGGHSDVLAGCATVRTLSQYQILKGYNCTMGTSQSSFDSSLLSRGLKTLHIRMERHSSNALHLAKFLEKHPKVKIVYYPGLTSHPDHQVAIKQMKAFGGMISFAVKGGSNAAKILVENVKIIHLAVSLGGIESLIEHVGYMTHGDWVMTQEDRDIAGLEPGLIRFSVGLEDVHDIEKDLIQALDRIPTEE